MALGPSEKALPHTGLSPELRSVLVMMLEPDPALRATAETLLALPAIRRSRPWSTLWDVAAQALSRGWALWQVSLLGDGLSPHPSLRCTQPGSVLSPQALLALLCWLWHRLVHPTSWLWPPHLPATPPHSPTRSLLDGSLSSHWDDDSLAG